MDLEIYAEYYSWVRLIIVAMTMLFFYYLVEDFLYCCPFGLPYESAEMNFHESVVYFQYHIGTIIPSVEGSLLNKLLVLNCRK